MWKKKNPKDSCCQSSNLRVTKLGGHLQCRPKSGTRIYFQWWFTQLQRNLIHTTLGTKSVLSDSIRIQNDLYKVQCVQNSENKIQHTPGKYWYWKGAVTCTNTKWKHTARQELAERNPGVNSDHKVNSNANGISEKGCTSFWVMLGGNTLRQSVNHLASWARKSLQRLLYLKKQLPLRKL